MRTAARPIPAISPEVEARLFSKIEIRPDGIWKWLGSRNGKYGWARFHIGYEPFYVNRIMWTLWMRRTEPGYQIPDNMRVCHRNDVTPELYDCNPENYFLGTDLENALDRERKGRGNHDAKRGDLNYLRKNPERALRGDNHPARLNPQQVARGERNGQSKLTWAKVHEIRALYAAGGLTQTEIGNRFGVTCHSVKKIVNQKSWKTEKWNAFAEKSAGLDGESGAVIRCG